MLKRALARDADVDDGRHAAVGGQRAAERRADLGRVVDALAVAAGQPIDVVDALRLEHVHDRLSRCA